MADNTAKDFIDSLNTKATYENFSEEVDILKETTAGKMTLYTVKNKNGVTFQQVPGQPGLEDRGFMGFVTGDRGRPIMLSGSVRVSETESTDNTGTTAINNAFGTVDMGSTVAYDIKLIADAGALGDDEEEKAYFLKVG